MKTTLILAIHIIVALSSSSQKKINFHALSRIKGITPRNVIFILTNDHRFDFIGFTGKLPWLRRPSNMDYLFEHGAWFKTLMLPRHYVHRAARAS
jgi:N-acetylglucosamine-6-sulfatase